MQFQQGDATQLPFPGRVVRRGVLPLSADSHRRSAARRLRDDARRAARRLVHYLREAGATDIRAGAWTELEYDITTIRRIYRLSAEATGPAAAAKGILTPSEVEDMIAGLIRLEDDESSVLVKLLRRWSAGCLL